MSNYDRRIRQGRSKEEVPLTCFQSIDSQRISLNNIQSLMIVRESDERGGPLYRTNNTNKYSYT